MSVVKYKIPDRKAPRYRPNYKQTLNKELFNTFKKKYSKYTDLDYETFKTIICTDNGNICKTVINERDGVKLRNAIGYVFIASCRYAQTSIDPIASAAKGELVTYTNLATDGLMAKIVYTNHANTGLFANNNLWGFIPVRQFKKLTSINYKENYTRYIPLECNDNICDLFKKTKDKNYYKNLEHYVLYDHNEFNLD